MSGLVFVCDAQRTPLMPMSSAYARKLLAKGKATLRSHHAFTIVQLSEVVPSPELKPITLTVRVTVNTAELLIQTEVKGKSCLLVRVIIDLRTDLIWRLRRRSAYRRRRRGRSRYRAPRRYAQPHALKRPSLAKSRWAKQLKRRSCRSLGRRPHHVPAVIRWRAEVILRVINALRSLVPISVVIIEKPGSRPNNNRNKKAADVRTRLMQTFGEPTDNGTVRAACAYCGTLERPLTVDHLLPKSRGGTDVRSNLVLACRSCNERKRDQMPEEAGLTLQRPVVSLPAEAQRAHPYSLQTAHVIQQFLSRTGLQVIVAHNTIPNNQEKTMFNDTRQTDKMVPTFVAKPISRGRKQRYTGRNYPLSLPLRPSYVHVRQTIKRRIQVNKGLVLRRQGKQNDVQVVTSEGAFPEDGQHVSLGMLCEGQRTGQRVRGVVAAIHSSGRITLLTPSDVQISRVTWQRTVVSPRQYFRVICDESIVFFYTEDIG